MKIIPGLTKSLTLEFGNRKLLTFAQSLLKNPPVGQPEVSEYVMNLGKKRKATAYTKEHQVVHALLARVMEEKLKGSFSKECVSFQKGRSASEVFKDLKVFLSEYKKENQNKKNRKLHVMRWDIKAYGDSIPLHEKSPLLKKCESRLKDHALTSWLKHELRAVVQESSKEARIVQPLTQCLENRKTEPNPLVQSSFQPFSTLRGLSFGSPLTPFFLNLYLEDFDEFIKKSYPNSFYRRFGDDCLLILKSVHEVEPIFRSLKNELKNLELKLNDEKTQQFEWSESGYQSKTTIEYLGRSVDFSGNLFLTKSKTDLIKENWKRILKNKNNVEFTKNKNALTVPLWNTFLKHPICEEIFSECTDSKRLKSFSDRLFQLTKKHQNMSGEKNYKSLHTVWNEKWKK